MLGITPMIGNNDVAGETFTTNDAVTLTQFAQQRGVGHVSYWALQRDRPGSGPLGEYSQVPQSLYQFYNTFKAVTGPVVPQPASIAVTAVYAGDASKITTHPNITVQAVCSASGSKTTTFLRAGVQHSPKKFIDVGVSAGFDDLADAGSFGLAGFFAVRI